MKKLSLFIVQMPKGFLTQMCFNVNAQTAFNVGNNEDA